MRLSIIIVHYRNPQLLRLCLKNLSADLKNYPELQVQSIVVDSMAENESKEISVNEFYGIDYIPFKENTGYAKGVNAGLKKANGDFILITQPDVIFEEKSIGQMLNYMRENPRVGLLGPKILNFDGTKQQSFFRFYNLATVIYRRTVFGKFSFAQKNLQRFEYKEKNNPETPIEVDWLMGAALLISRESLTEVGLMDERFFMYFEDVDWAKRFWHKGFSVIYFPKATAYHWLGRASKSWFGAFDPIFNKQTRIHIKSAIKYFFKWHGFNFFNNENKKFISAT